MKMKCYQNYKTFISAIIYLNFLRKNLFFRLEKDNINIFLKNFMKIKLKINYLYEYIINFKFIYVNIYKYSVMKIYLYIIAYYKLKKF